MSECICSSCRNLKPVISDHSGDEKFACSFGFPAKECMDCPGEDCGLTCAHYEDDTKETERSVKCSGCGKELKQSFHDSDEGEVFCIDCYLNKEGNGE